VTGGCASFPFFSDRLNKELQQIRPFQSTFNVSLADSVTLDAWRGARKWAESSEMAASSVTVAEYNEKGGEYLKEHCASNIYLPSVTVQE